jgi:hypothetical protein
VLLHGELHCNRFLGSCRLTVKDEECLSKRAEQRPRRDNRQHEPYHEKVDPDVRFRSFDLNEPLPSRVKPPSDARNEQRTGMTGNAGRGEA